MICQRCVLRLQRTAPRSVRNYAIKSKSGNTSSIASKKARGTPTETRQGPPAATSKSDAQPFSARERAPGLPQRSPSAQPLDPSGSVTEIESLPRVKSSVPAGQPLKGLSYFKNKEGPVALEDHEYPPWLWTLLDNGSKGNNSDSAAMDGNLYSKSKAQRKKAMKAAMKTAKEDPGAHLPRVPIEHQTVNLPSGDGSLESAMHAGDVRGELRAAMRQRRRNAIKEMNYLKTMG